MAIKDGMSNSEMFFEMHRLVLADDPETRSVEHFVKDQKCMVFINDTSDRYTMLVIVIDENGHVPDLSSGRHKIVSYDKASDEYAKAFSSIH